MKQKKALVKLAQVRLAINHVLRNRMTKQANSLSRLGYDAAKFYGGAGSAFGVDAWDNAMRTSPEFMRTAYRGINKGINQLQPYFKNTPKSKPVSPQQSDMINTLNGINLKDWRDTFDKIKMPKEKSNTLDGRLMQSKE